MKRSGTVSRKIAKARRRKATKAKPGRLPIPARRGHSSVIDLQEKLHRQTRELNEAHEQQAATSEVLEIIGHSTFDLPRVLESLLEKAVRLCGADRGFIFHTGWRRLSLCGQLWPLGLICRKNRETVSDNPGSRVGIGASHFRAPRGPHSRYPR